MKRIKDDTLLLQPKKNKTVDKLTKGAAANGMAKKVPVKVMKDKKQTKTTKPLTKSSATSEAAEDEIVIDPQQQPKFKPTEQFIEKEKDWEKMSAWDSVEDRAKFALKGRKSIVLKTFRINAETGEQTAEIDYAINGGTNENDTSFHRWTRDEEEEDQ